MAYTALEICSVDVSGTARRGAKATCGHCGITQSLPVNTMRSHGDDDTLHDKHANSKFERVGWKIGRSPHQNRCPECFTAIKISSHRKREDNMANNKIVPMTPVSPPPSPTAAPAVEPLRTMTRDERRIIFEKINEVYVGETTGYHGNWSDEVVARDLGVPRAWVSALREEYFGPDVNENHNSANEEAKAFLAELRALQDSITNDVRALFIKAKEVRKTIERLLEK